MSIFTNLDVTLFKMTLYYSKTSIQKENVSEYHFFKNLITTFLILWFQNTNHEHLHHITQMCHLQKKKKLRPKGICRHQIDNEILVYLKRPKSKYKEKFTLDTLRKSNQFMHPSNLKSSFNAGSFEPHTNDLPITLKK